MTRRVLFCLLAFTAIAALPGFAQGERAGSFDHKFLSKVPHHHQAAIQMAELCQQKATHPELKTLCSKIASDQRSEMEQMDLWRSQWFNGGEMRLPAEMQKMQAEQKKRMATLHAENAASFDHAFLMAMTKHHREGMPDMKACVAQADNADLKSLCRKMTGEQQKETAQMDEWRRAWFKGHGDGHSKPASKKQD